MKTGNGNVVGAAVGPSNAGGRPSFLASCRPSVAPFPPDAPVRILALSRNEEMVADWRERGRLFQTGLSVAEARALQEDLRTEFVAAPIDFSKVRLVAGADLSFERGSDDVCAGFVLLRFPELELVERIAIRTRAPFPYVPGLLSFREIPPLLEAWERLQRRPDAVIADGHGFAHPRRFGFASHLGWTLDLPTVGCAKSILVGVHEPVGPGPGAWQPLEDRGETIGAALRTRARASPVFVSIGHRSDLPSAIELALRCVRNTRVPETTRLAHALVNQLRRSAAAELY